MYYQAIYKVEGYIRKIGSVFKDKEECEKVAKAIVKGAPYWSYHIVEQKVNEQEGNKND